MKTSHATVSDNADLFRIQASQKLDQDTRSELGQYMTPVDTCRYMASLFNECNQKHISMLDPGSGVGSLTTAFVEELIHKKSKIERVDITAYEIEEQLLPYLEQTLNSLSSTCFEKAITCDYKKKNCDFIEQSVKRLTLNSNSVKEGLYTHAIMNPPYKKISSSSNHKKLLRSIGIDVTNMYTAFVALTIKQLKPGGELVAIIPRSFCNGPYFKAFRELLLSEMSIEHIHIFNERAAAFKSDNVLQENIILHAIKKKQSNAVTISSSSGKANYVFDEMHGYYPDDLTSRSVDYRNIVNPLDSQSFIHIASSSLDQKIVDRLSVFTSSLEDLDIEVSTGPVVDFRMKEELCDLPENNTAPLLYPVHFKSDGLTWPINGKKKNAIQITPDTQKWLWKNKGTFLVTRRFSSKEQKKRLIASIYNSSLPGGYIGFENHLNVYHSKQNGFNDDQAWGLYVFLNSTLLDQYFRQFNGHTQVNATDLRFLNYPNLETLARMGKRIKLETDITQNTIDLILNEEINHMDTSEASDPLLVQKRIDEALDILKKFGLPKSQQNERSAMTLLALLNLAPNQDWSESNRPLIGITPIMDFCRLTYDRHYAPNTRETFRRQTMHQFVEAGLAIYNPDKPDRPVNSPKACYQIGPEAYDALIAYDTSEWAQKLESFLQ